MAGNDIFSENNNNFLFLPRETQKKGEFSDCVVYDGDSKNMILVYRQLNRTRKKSLANCLVILYHVK